MATGAAPVSDRDREKACGRCPSRCPPAENAHKSRLTHSAQFDEKCAYVAHRDIPPELLPACSWAPVRQWRAGTLSTRPWEPGRAWRPRLAVVSPKENPHLRGPFPRRLSSRRQMEPRWMPLLMERRIHPVILPFLKTEHTNLKDLRRTLQFNFCVKRPANFYP